MTDQREAMELADKILKASGSGLRFFTPESKERIISVTMIEIVNIKNSVILKDVSFK